MECEYETHRADDLNQISDEAVRFETSIVDLNDYCLLKVFSYLDLLDMINIRFMCKRLCEVSRMTAYKFKCFRMYTFGRNMKHRAQLITMLHFDSVINFIAPFVELIDMTTNPATNCTNDDMVNVLQKYELPKLKSLSLVEACHLKYIKNRNIEELTVLDVKRSELNNYSCGITKVKSLTLVTVGTCVPISELLHFFENNSNLERLVFVRELGRKINADFFKAVKNLKMLDLRLGKNYRDVQHILQVENLTELALERLTSSVSFNDTVESILTSFVQKQTLKSLELRNIYFDNIVNILEQLNLDSLRFVSSHNHEVFHQRFINVPFPTLKHLDIVGPIEMIRFFNLIKHLTALEDLHFSMLRPYDKDALLRQMARLLRVRRARPDLKISFLTMPLKVKIYFALGCYEMEDHGRKFAAVIPHD